MTDKEIKKELLFIEAIKGDDETAHSHEDALVWNFVKDIAKHENGE